MYLHQAILLVPLALATGANAAPELNCKRGAVEARAEAVTVTNILPTQSYVSPDDAECTMTYTTVLPSMGTDAGRKPTGVADHTYTMAFGCDGSSGSPCHLQPSPSDCPPGFTTTIAVCEKCAHNGGPATYTLTVPEHTAATAGGSSSTSSPSSPAASGENKNGPADAPSPGGATGPDNSAETLENNIPGGSEGHDEESAPSATDTVEGKGADNAGSGSGSSSGNTSGNDNEDSSGDSSGGTVEVSEGSAIIVDIRKTVEIVLVSAMFLVLNM